MVNTLTHCSPVLSLCRKQSIDLHCKPPGCFLYNGNTVLKWVKGRNFLQGFYMKYICNVIFPTAAFFTAFLLCMYFMYNPTYFVFGSRPVRIDTL